MSGHMARSANLGRSRAPIRSAWCRNQSQKRSRVLLFACCSVPLARNSASVYFGLRHFGRRRSGCPVKSLCMICGIRTPGISDGTDALVYRSRSGVRSRRVSGRTSAPRRASSVVPSQLSWASAAVIRSRHARAMSGAASCCLESSVLLKYSFSSPVSALNASFSVKVMKS